MSQNRHKLAYYQRGLKAIQMVDKSKLAIATTQTQNPFLLKLNYYSTY